MSIQKLQFETQYTEREMAKLRFRTDITSFFRTEFALQNAKVNIEGLLGQLFNWKGKPHIVFEDP